MDIFPVSFAPNASSSPFFVIHKGVFVLYKILLEYYYDMDMVMVRCGLPIIQHKTSPRNVCVYKLVF